MEQLVKDPAEIVTVTFDFSALATSVSNPVISCIPVVKLDPNAASMISGTPQISDCKVLQRIIGGASGNDYKLRCEIDDADGEHYVLTALLSVQTF